jgi:hypothetical protein
MGTEKVKKEEVVQRTQLDNKSPIQVDPTRVCTVADKNSAITPLDLRPNSRRLGFQGQYRRSARAIQLRNEYAIDLTYHGPMNLRGRGAERKTCPKLDPALAHSGLQMSWSADSAGKRYFQRISGLLKPGEHTLDREYCSEAADAGGGIGAQVALRKAEKMGAPNG